MHRNEDFHRDGYPIVIPAKAGIQFFGVASTRLEQE